MSEEEKTDRQLPDDPDYNVPIVHAFVDRSVLIVWISRSGEVKREQRVYYDEA